MDETRYIRGRRVVFERKEPVENLSFTLDVFDARDNSIEVLGAAVAKHPDKRICLRQMCRVIRSSDEPR